MGTARERVVFDQFRGWSRYNHPASSVLRPRMLRQGEVMEALNCTFRADGAICWQRDQFIIPVSNLSGLNLTTKKPLALWEYKTAAQNDLLMPCSNGAVYKLDTDWSAETVSQVTQGYQIDFGNWSSDVASGVAGWASPSTWTYSAAQVRDVLMIAHSGQPCFRWNGTNLVEVGIDGPTAAMVGDTGAGILGSAEAQDHTDSTWTETDTAGRIAVAATTLTVVDLDTDEEARVVKDITDSPLDEFEITFKVNVSDNDMVINSIFGLANGDTGIYDEFSNHNAVIALNVVPVSTNKFRLYLVTQEDNSTVPHYTYCSYEFLESTDYYIVVTRDAAQVTASAYTDSGHTTQVGDTMTCPLSGAREYLYAFDATGTGAGGVAGSLVITGYSISRMTTPPGPLAQGTYSYYYTYYDGEFESKPSPVNNVHVTHDNGALVNLSSIPDRSAQTQICSIYRGYTSDDSEDAEAGDFYWVADLSSAATTYEDTQTAAELGDAIAFKHCRPPHGTEMVWHQSRLYMAGLTATSEDHDVQMTVTGGSHLQNLLCYSEIDEPYYFPDENMIWVGGAEAIVALQPWRHMLLIFKESSLWSLTGYDPQTDFTLEELDAQTGLANRGAVAAGSPGVVWKSSQGIMFFNGATVRMIYDYDQLPSSPALTETYPTVVYHRDRFYILEGSEIMIWDPIADVWEHRLADVDVLGLWAYDLGRKQSHILGAMHYDADDAAGTIGNLVAMDTARAWSNYSAMGSGAWADNDYYGKVRITMPALVAPPGMLVVPHEVWVTGTWTDLTGGDGTQDLKIFVNATADYTKNAWATTPDAPSNGVIGVPQDSSATWTPQAANAVYIQLQASHAKDLVIYGVECVYSLRQARGA
jgi:hypothetical protein